MKKILNLIPHLCIAFALALITLLIFNNHNPRMGFTQGIPFIVLVVCSAVVSVLTAILALAKSGKYENR